MKELFKKSDGSALSLIDVSLRNQHISNDPALYYAYEENRVNIMFTDYEFTSKIEGQFLLPSFV